MSGPHLAHTTERDPSLPHQVVLATATGGTQITVSCNCREVGANQAGPHYAPMGVTACIEDSRMLYNDPDNHWIPFTSEDVAKW